MRYAVILKRSFWQGDFNEIKMLDVVTFQRPLQDGDAKECYIMCL